jgi:hypothetical protein
MVKTAAERWGVNLNSEFMTMNSAAKKLSGN